MRGHGRAPNQGRQRERREQVARRPGRACAPRGSRRLWGDLLQRREVFRAVRRVEMDRGPRESSRGSGPLLLPGKRSCCQKRSRRGLESMHACVSHVLTNIHASLSSRPCAYMARKCKIVFPFSFSCRNVDWPKRPAHCKRMKDASAFPASWLR